MLGSRVHLGEERRATLRIRAQSAESRAGAGGQIQLRSALGFDH